MTNDDIVTRRDERRKCAIDGQSLEPHEAIHGVADRCARVNQRFEHAVPPQLDGTADPHRERVVAGETNRGSPQPFLGCEGESRLRATQTDGIDGGGGKQLTAVHTGVRGRVNDDLGVPRRDSKKRQTRCTAIVRSIE